MSNTLNTFKVNKKRIINTFLELVSLDSSPGNERAVARVIKNKLGKLPCTIREDQAGKKIGGSTGNIIVDFSPSPGQEENPVLLLSAHMDKISPGTGSKPRISGDYITSANDGSLGADDLAGVTGIIEGLRNIQKQGIKRGPIKIIFTVAEEEGLQGAKCLNDRELKDCDYGAVFDAEGDIGTIIYRAPYKMKFNAVIRGQSAHAGIEPGKGINAIKIASQAISNMNLGVIDEETTANIGVIRGGVARNVVPDLIELQGEVRSHSMDKLKEVIQEMKKITQKAVHQYRGEVDFDISLLYQGFSLNKNNPFVKYTAGVVRELNLPLRFQVSGGGNDACIFNNRGVPALNLGTGIENAHSDNEKIKKENLYRLVKFIISLLTNADRIDDV